MTKPVAHMVEDLTAIIADVLYEHKYTCKLYSPEIFSVAGEVAQKVLDGHQLLTKVEIDGNRYLDDRNDKHQVLKEVEEHDGQSRYVYVAKPLM